ncbi:hypothetical protein [Limnoglobus roseus]|uniref:PH domain-containing protein n=1 Tax=Limnoglobus roseus TaxID=2598579 RepID=A0A5C1AJ29_9BACT|nr:hypothetical protein [Limnoglobus roseus]QEL18665.1 hypothetical protein PX52LOC_05699 [Limnoglobus roseus]
MSDSDRRLADVSNSRFGEPEAVFTSGPGQTAAGMMVGLTLAAVCFAATLTAEGVQPTSRFLIVGLGLAGTGFAYWIFRLRKWRLSVCPGGVVQVRAWSVDEAAWSEVREVVVTRVKGTASPYKVTVVTAAGEIVVSPINCRRREQLFETLQDAAARRQIAVHTEWVEPSD